MFMFIFLEEMFPSGFDRIDHFKGDMIMSSYAARMYVLKCFLLRKHSMQQKLQVWTVDIVKFLPNYCKRSQD